ncbi:hypothetical protein [Legionella pneumophila]|uniref:Dot/Icm secretion system substrate n=1 Tax=Legionella pneumophila subsp. pascullei TaxID=91890 RepID=A0AAX2IT28_LEGPN|nr:hypothetical protein [Legionella pneumophila]AMP88214.1 hypothetical protein AXF35_00230 [Legionella pneumophila subsp. pascullei]AMP91123.1 hypothetical protein AXF36_00230 [Legionella pneumophila subsp. pascullei]AMP94110.1 hypothetical protein AXF37_00230 [Legionella pneumophila subsp. pascullei]SQG88884.1 Dot/Icm secretion system substrate [Legionella pneumophila subsp. pascullei]VEH03934.1 Dot/Icm secretion system substrate [Legionella pneumophila subsp. pascullei]
MKSTNNMQKKETDKLTLEQTQKEARRNNAPDFIPGASPYYNLYCFFYRLCHGEETSKQHQASTSFQHGK